MNKSEVENILKKLYPLCDNVFEPLDQNLKFSLLEARDILANCDFDRCLFLCEMVLDALWEGLNTGHWKEVNVAWRKGYTFASHIKALAQLSALEMELEGTLKYFNCYFKSTSRLEIIKNTIRTCDMGLLMGCPNPNDALYQLASYVHKNFAQEYLLNFVEPMTSCSCFDEPPIKKVKLTNCKEKIEILDEPSLMFFVQNFFNYKKPVIIKGCMDDWPAKSKWNINYLKKIAGFRTVPVEIGSKYTDESWSQKLMTVEDFIETHLLGKNNKEVGYLAQHQLLDQIPELLEDIIVPDYCALSDDGQAEINAWFGPANTVSPLHRDEKHNIFCQVRGEKYFRLYNPIYTDKLHVHENHLLKTTSQIDVENPDLDRFPGFASVPYFEFTLLAGDMLFIPSMYWHYVRSVSTSFSISFWWKDERLNI